MDGKKSFGLIIPKKTKTFNPKKSGIFGSDSDDESTPRQKMPKIPQSKPIASKSTKVEVLEDPSIYEYDSIYDDMKAQKAAEIAPKEKKSARYIDSLLKAADKRKKEHERRLEKKVQLEREKEGDKFKDKEMFVTSAYKKKMQEREEEEERERRENELNDMMDVTKQKDLSGFYRHFLKQSVGEEKVPVFGEKIKIKEEPHSSPDNKQAQSIDSKSVTDTHSFPDDKDDSDMEKSTDEDDDTVNSYEKAQRVRKYRKRTNSERSEGYSESETEKCSKNSSNKNVKSSKESSSKRPHLGQRKTQSESLSQETYDSKSLVEKTSFKGKENLEESPKKKVKYSSDEDEEDTDDNEQENDIVPKPQRKRNDSDSSSASDEKKGDEESPESRAVENGVKSNDREKENVSKTSRNIYEKRTVGEVFAEAQARYFQRLAARGS